MSLLLAAALVSFSMPAPEPVDLGRLILAIEERENGKWTSPGGRACWKRETWAQFTILDYAKSCKPDLSRMVQGWALQSYSERFEAEGIPATPWRLAMAWRLGYDGAKRARRSADDYGTRTEAIYESLAP